MNERQLTILINRGTDVESAVRNLCNNESLYETCVLEFLNDTCVAQLNKSIADSRWDDAFTAAHALKGVAGNLGFVPLMHSTAQLIVLIRSGRIKEVNESLAVVNSKYRDIIDGIKLCQIHKNSL